MSRLSRRTVLSGLGAFGFTSKWPTFAQSSPKIVVVGGGFGGSTFARHISLLYPKAEVTIVDPSATYFACPLSNLVIAGERKLNQQEIQRSYNQILNLTYVQSAAQKIDANKKLVTLVDQSTISYDKLVVSPGVDIKWNAIEGYDRNSSKTMPHAWKSGEQTQLLRNALTEMEDGGLIIISVPRAPFRCPPGPYERASLMAYYLRHNKPKSKILILDANEKFSKQPQFTHEWKQNYGSLIEWKSNAHDGTVNRIHSQSKTVFTDFERYKPAIANIIPPHEAGEIAQRGGLTDGTGWCPINSLTFESKLKKDIYVLGDATIAAPMPKSAFSANMQAKICAVQLARNLSGLEENETVLANTCYSFVSPGSAISIVGVYSNKNAFSSIESAGGVSPIIATDYDRRAEARQANSWFSTITFDAFG